MSVRTKRLENDYKELTQLVNDSDGSIVISSTRGRPPERYELEYKCRGIEKLRRSEPVFRNSHRVVITLDNNYPRESPEAKFLTPIFHPNVWENLNVCLGEIWTMGETLSELVLRIGKIIQYSKDVLNLDSPANVTAKNWAASNMHRFPVDTKTFKSTLSSEIIWEDMDISFTDL